MTDLNLFLEICFLIVSSVERFNYFLRSWSRSKTLTRLFSKEKSSSRTPSNQLTNSSTVRKKSKDILAEFDYYIFSVGNLFVGLFYLCVYNNLWHNFPLLEQSIKLVNLLLSYIPGYILENKGCIQFNCKGRH